MVLARPGGGVAAGSDGVPLKYQSLLTEPPPCAWYRLSLGDGNGPGVCLLPVPTPFSVWLGSSLHPEVETATLPLSLAGLALALANRMDRSGVGLRGPRAAHSDLVRQRWLTVRIVWIVSSPNTRVWQAHGKPGWKLGSSQGKRLL